MNFMYMHHLKLISSIRLMKATVTDVLQQDIMLLEDIYVDYINPYINYLFVVQTK
jgi:hypothetical protein